MVVRDVQAILQVATAESHMHRETPSQLDDVVYPCMQVGWQERLNQRQFEFWPQEVADVASLHDSLQVPVVVFHAQPAPQFAGVVLARQDGLHCCELSQRQAGLAWQDCNVGETAQAS